VNVAKVERSQSQQGLVLPGTTIPLTEAYVYARASGYLKTRLVDIGDHVRKDQLLAVVDAPDLDQQVAQAKQQLMQAERQLDLQRSQLALATVTVQRYRVLVRKGVFSQQDGDQQETNYASQVANVQAAQRNVDAYRANLDRMIALQSYEFVRAPFAGVITQRNVDVGALIAASGVTSGAENAPAPEGQTSTSGGSQQAGQVNTGGSSGATSTAATTTQSPGQGGPLFGLAQTQRLRILVSVPEGYLTAIHVGGHAQLTFQEYAGVNVTGEITRTANSVDPNTRTMLTEVQVDNRSGKMVPGMYTVVTFPPMPGTDAPLLVTGDAIVIRHDRPTLAKVVDGKIHLQPVTIGRDFGGVVEILTGLQAGDIIVTNVTDDVVEGAEVQLHFTKTPEQESEQQPPQNGPSEGKRSPGESKS
jgi:multidrug efflux pump subunit AcrA (membrane-fusion protein)